MLLRFTLNDKPQTWEAAPNESLLDALRRHGVFGVKHGCETGECGACAVLLDGKPVTSCTMLAAQAGGHTVATVESLGEHPADCCAVVVPPAACAEGARLVAPPAAVTVRKLNGKVVLKGLTRHRSLLFHK